MLQKPRIMLTMGIIMTGSIMATVKTCIITMQARQCKAGTWFMTITAARRVTTNKDILLIRWG